MKIIMISGKSGHGKDTVASMLKNELEKQNKRILLIHFADPVKWFAKNFYNWDGNKDEKGRGLLQYIGTTLMRNYDIYYWGNMISEFIAANGQKEAFDYAIIPDWRFLSEKAAIRTYNEDIFTIRVIRYEDNGTLYKNPLMTTEQLNHISEIELDNSHFDMTIINKGDLNQLYESVKFTCEILT